MHSAELRERFLKYFEARGHTVVASDGLVPSGDPTVLFTSAGMNQFKDAFLGKRADLARAASSQKCLRTGDLDGVGDDSHHSFFEMLGNFSFGDYFKAEAIHWAWEFLTGTATFDGHPAEAKVKPFCLALPASKLWVSIYQEDEEAFRLWRDLGMPEPRLLRFGQADNFWPANAPKEGPNGPCGPCSEIYFAADGKVDKDASLEIWNLVFAQFDRQPDGSLKPLPRKSIDTGMGLERLARVLQGTPTDYETDLFAPIIATIRRWPRGSKVKRERVEFAERAIADHARGIVFLLAEGILPSNEGRGYVTRMLIRRSYRLARVVLDLEPQAAAEALCALREAVAETLGRSPYARELAGKLETAVRRAWAQELAQFSATLEQGTARLEELMAGLKQKLVPGEEAFKLHDTYGFPLELTLDVARERGFRVDRAGFDAAFKAQQARSRAGSQFGGDVFAAETLPVRQAIPQLPSKDEQFLGYKTLTSPAAVKGLWDGAKWVTRVSAGSRVGIVLDHSPFYGEAGGQAGDTGRIEGPAGVADVGQTTWIDDVLVHHAHVREGTLSVQEPVQAKVDADRRLQVARSHTAAHMLHWALRKVLGPETVQAGSYVEADRVRFDFSSLSGLHEEQRAQVEALVNQRVRLADEVRTAEMRLEEAKQAGALALFGEKYGGKVRVVTIGDYSKELCGGTHLHHTGYVGTFLITAESSIAAGTRRVEALVGDHAAEQLAVQQHVLQELARRMSRPVPELTAGFEELLAQMKRLEREKKDLQLQLAQVESARLRAQAKDVGRGVQFIAATIKQADREVLVAYADALRRSVEGEAVVCLASGDGGGAPFSLVMAITAGVAKQVDAGKLMKAVAPTVQGTGGGRPDFAQGGGKDFSKIGEAWQQAERLVREAVGQAA